MNFKDLCSVLNFNQLTKSQQKATISKKIPILLNACSGIWKTQTIASTKISDVHKLINLIIEQNKNKKEF